MSRLLLLVAVLAGTLMPVQFALNGRLAHYTDSVTVTAAISYATGALALALGLLIGGRGRLPLAGLRGAPAWSFLGGVVGSAYVVGSVVLTRTLGTALAVTLVIAAQTLVALALDHFGALGLTRRPLNTVRLAVAGLVVAALVLQIV